MFKVGSIGLSYIYNLFTQKEYEKEDKEDNDNEFDRLRINSNKMKILRNTLENYGGVFSKISQMLMYDEYDDSIFNECKPNSRDKTTLYLEEYVRDNILTYTVEKEIYKSGSIGQVHIGYKDNKKIAIKVQYKDLIDETEEDLKVLNMLVNCLYYFGDFKESIENIRTKIYEEFNYENECKNHKLLPELWINTYIYIPKIYTNLCTNKILVTEFVEGEDFDWSN